MASKAKGHSTLGLVFGQNLRSRREAMGYTREELAELSQLSPQNIAKIENGDRFVTLQSLTSLASAVECDPFELFMQARKGDSFDESLEQLFLLLKNKTKKEIEMAHEVLALIFKGLK
jgi:transcriptional regulator with XRE-family HTH domain